jgi:hypothetical protein
MFRFEVITALKIHTTIFQVMALCNLVGGSEFFVGTNISAFRAEVAQVGKNSRLYRRGGEQETGHGGRSGQSDQG